MKKKIRIPEDYLILLQEILKGIRLLLEKQQLESSKETEYYDNADMKKILKLNDKSLYRYRLDGTLKFVKIGRKIFYRKNDYLNTDKDKSTS